MFWKKKHEQLTLSIACTLTDNDYCLTVIANNYQILFSQHRVFNDNTDNRLTAALAADIDHLNLIGHECTLILLPSQYQLILMDALDIPEAEIAKALRWSLKGLSDYDLEDVAIDTCLLPTIDKEDKQKTFVAITPLTILNTRCALLESVFLKVKAVTISEIALKNLFPLVRSHQAVPIDKPIIVMSLCNNTRQIHIVYQDLFYLIRELASQTEGLDETTELENLLLEIKRSVDYCVNQLNLAHPTHLFFTPGFHHASLFSKPIQEKFNLNTEIIDLNQYLQLDPALDLEQQQKVFYSIVGALHIQEEATLA